MKQSLINQSTYVRYKLDQIPEMTYPECIDALQLLNYLLRRADASEAQEEIHQFIEQINSQVEELKKLGLLSDLPPADAEQED